MSGFTKASQAHILLGLDWNALPVYEHPENRGVVVLPVDMRTASLLNVGSLVLVGDDEVVADGTVIEIEATATRDDWLMVSVRFTGEQRLSAPTSPRGRAGASAGEQGE